MTKPIKRAPEIQGLIDGMAKAQTGMGQAECAEKRVCTWCGGDASEFRNEISRGEYRISGFCQKCQDETFGKE